jgi:hypothetical protein
MEFEYAFASGLALFIIGISFFYNRINFIKKGHVTVATLFKLEACLDNENNVYYIPSFKFTNYNHKEIIYKHESIEWNPAWRLGEKVKLVYKEGNFDDHEILLITTTNVFGLSLIFLPLGILFLFIAGGLYWHISGKTLCYLIPGSICIFIVVFFLWSNRFFSSLDHS